MIYFSIHTPIAGVIKTLGNIAIIKNKPERRRECVVFKINKGNTTGKTAPENSDKQREINKYLILDKVNSLKSDLIFLNYKTKNQ